MTISNRLYYQQRSLRWALTEHGILLRYGSHQFGGLGLRKLETEATIKKIQGFQSLMEKPYSSRLITIVL